MKRSIFIGRGVVILVAAVVLLDSFVGAQTFTSTGSMIYARAHHTATLLNNGMVLIAGGTAGSAPLASAELYDPATGTFAITGSMNTARAAAKAVLLNDGKVLISGGDSGTKAIATAELYDPETGAFASIENMNFPRYQATVTLLKNGKVLIAGGWTGSTNPPDGSPLSNAELYDPETKEFALIGPLTCPRYLHTAALLEDGQVLLAGGSLAPNSNYLTSAELYDSEEGPFKASAGSMNTGREWYATVLLRNGKVLIAGGWRDALPNHLVDAELYEPDIDAFVSTGSMNIDRYGHVGTLLNDGKVLITGGSSLNYPGKTTAELYDPATGVFTFTSDMTVFRSSHTATLLNNGKVLITGGGNVSGILASAELYSPTPIFSFEGFFNPVENPPTVNKAVAGQSIPVKWRITDSNGVPVSDSSSFVSITSYLISCEDLAGDPTSAVEEYVSGSSGLQYLGDGWWQFNWKTPKAYSSQCRTMKLTLSDQKEYTANFSFK